MQVTNERGVVAQTYHELQAISVLADARDAYPLPAASPESSIRAIFQAVDIALLNLKDLAARATCDIARGDLNGAVVKLSWSRGFHRVMVRIGSLPYELSEQVVDNDPPGMLQIADSPAYSGFKEAFAKLQDAIDEHARRFDLDLEAIIADESIDSVPFRVLHLMRLMIHETRLWEDSLAQVAVPVPVPSYSEFVVSDLMEAAVYDTTLEGDTYFTQFRGLHQVPEILGFEINDRLEAAIVALRDDQVSRAVEQLQEINTLGTAVLESMPAISDNLSTADYHQIRENLGLTSGSHSVCFHFHMFRDLYDQLAAATNTCVVKHCSTDTTEDTLASALRQSALRRHEDPAAFLLHTLVTECLRFRIFTRNWRGLHLHLPRNNLGGEHTRSLTGAKDAVTAVQGMYDSARNKDPFTPFAAVRSAGRANGVDTRKSSTGTDEESSLDDQLLGITGAITKQRFSAVQERTGVFASSCPFSPPGKRTV